VIAHDGTSLMPRTRELFTDLPLDSLIESLESEVPLPATTRAEPVPEGKKLSKKLIRRYFNEVIYPYPDPLPLRDYMQQKLRLQMELVKLQNWVHDTGQKLVFIFEGRDAAGKGSTIRAFMEHLNPRWSKVVALDKPTSLEQGQWYFQRYVKELPTEGQIAFFDRSWYNRAGVERVMGFCTPQDYQDFLEITPGFETMLVKSGIQVVKFYLSVSKAEQAARFEERETNPLKQWKLSPVDLEAQQKWDDYTDAKNRMFELTDTPEVPWIIIKTEQKMRARLEAMRFVLNRFDYDGKDESIAIEPDPLIVCPVALLFDKQGHSNMQD